MKLAKVIGTVVATQKDRGLVGRKLLVVRDLKVDGSVAEGFAIAVDAVGAGVGETVLTVSGSSSRLTAVTQDTPVDTAIIGIVDTVEADGTVVFRKHERPSAPAKRRRKP
jgi:microcompartment protein CcmK/EutM